MANNLSTEMRKVKAIRELDKHPISEVIIWLIEALDSNYPPDWKKAFEIVRNKPWSEIRADIIQRVQSQEYEKIHEIAEEMLKTDLLLNMEVLRSMKTVKDMGNLACFYEKHPNIGLFSVISTVNSEVKNVKIETYILYRYFTGRPRLNNGFFSKF